MSKALEGEEEQNYQSGYHSMIIHRSQSLIGEKWEIW